MKRLLAILLLTVTSAFAQNTAVFPGAVATDQTVLVAAKDAHGVLNAPIDADDTVITLQAGQGSKFKAYSAVHVGTEQVLVCSIAVDTLNVCPGGRGFDGTTANPHDAGTYVDDFASAYHHNQVAAELKAVQNALGVNLGNVVRVAGSYSDPSWLTLTKAKVGLSNVENTALSTWVGSGNITTIGTLSSGTVPWARLSGVPTFYYQMVKANGTNQTARNAMNFSTNFSVTDDAANNETDISIATNGLSATHLTAGDYSSKINSGTYSISISGNAGSVTNGLYSNGSYSDPSWLTLSKAKVGLGNVENTALSTWVGSGNITTIGTLSSGTVPWARLSNVPSFITNAVTSRVRAADLGCEASYANSCDAGGNGRIDNADYATSAGSATTATTATSATQFTGTRQINFVYGGDPNNVIANTTVNRVYFNYSFANGMTLTYLACWTDAGTVNLQLVRSDGTTMNTAISCGTAGTATSTFTTATVAYNQGIGFITSSASTVKNLSVAITYTPSY